MRFLLLLTLLASSCFAADTFLVTEKGIWKVQNGEPIRTSQPGDTVYLAFPEGTPGPTPPGPTDPVPPTNPPTEPNPSKPLADRVASWADTVAEPAARSAFASVYKLSAERFTNWEATIAVINQTREVMLLGAKPGWRNVFTNIDTALKIAPHTKETLLEVAEGLSRQNSLDPEVTGIIPEPLQGKDKVEQVNWFKLAQCIPCILDAFSGGLLPGGGRFFNRGQGEVEVETNTKPVEIPKSLLKFTTSEVPCCGAKEEEPETAVKQTLFEVLLREQLEKEYGDVK